ncbi:MAG: betaine-aldehyde dehydrogenase [Lysobacterales bacterium]|jgi:betaine-aldehyde dehydrogenase
MSSSDKYGPETRLPVQQSYVGGTFVANNTGETFSNRHPGNDQIICEVEVADKELIDQAVASSHVAFQEWARMPAVERGQILRKAASILRERNNELALLETLDTGKPVSETSEVDIKTGADVLEYFAGVAQSIHGQHIDLPPDAFAMVRREPIGVCAGIGAWNYPIQIAMWKSGPALACGNTMVFKPAEQTPLSALRLAEIYTEAGMPPGVFNVVQGGRETGAALITHAKVAKISLTGSVETGKKVLASAAADLKKVTLELGGKSPIIVFDDADFDSAINAALVANFFSTGQVCSNGTRVFVQKGIYTAFIEELASRARVIRIGDPFDPQTQMGPLVSREQHEKVMGYMNIAKQSAARHVCGGDDMSQGDFANGYYVSPAIFADCNDEMEFVQQEVFGPLMSVLSFESESEAIDRANNTNFGLSGAVFSSDFNKAHRVANQIQAGMVWINDYNITPPEVPFGGYKHSGLGRENGLQAIEYYTQLKTIYANLGKVPRTY